MVRSGDSLEGSGKIVEGCGNSGGGPYQLTRS